MPKDANDLDALEKAYRQEKERNERPVRYMTKDEKKKIEKTLNPPEPMPAEADCAFCKAENRAELEERCATGDLSKKVVADGLSMTPTQVYHHMMHHFTRFAGKGENGKAAEGEVIHNEIKKLYNKHDIIFNLMVDLKERLDLYFTKDEFNPEETGEIVKMVDSVRKLVETLQVLETGLKQEEDLVMKNYEDLKKIILSKLCPMCRVSILEALEQAEKKNAEIVTVEIKKAEEVTIPDWK